MMIPRFRKYDVNVVWAILAPYYQRLNYFQLPTDEYVQKRVVGKLVITDSKRNIDAFYFCCYFHFVYLRSADIYTLVHEFTHFVQVFSCGGVLRYSKLYNMQPMLYDDVIRGISLAIIMNLTCCERDILLHVIGQGECKHVV